MKSNLIVSYFLSIVISFLFIFSCGNVAEEAVQKITDEALKNLCPVATADTYTVVSGGTLTTTFNNGVLSNDADPGGGAMSASVILVPKNGTLALNTDGSFTYVHDGSGTGEDKFLYVASNTTCDNTFEPEFSSMAEVIITITEQPSLPSGSVYVAGYYNENATDYGCYWTDDNGDGIWDRTVLEDARIIEDIAVHNGKVYAVGETTWAIGEQDPAIWIDGVKTELKTPNMDESWGGATAFSIAFDGNDIYVSGNYASKKVALGAVSGACYWKITPGNPEGQHVPLTNNNVSSDAYGIAVLNGEPISVGWYMGGHNIYPAKWIGTKMSKLDNKNDGEGQDIVVDGNDYYISGWTDNARNATHYYPTVWKNGQNKRKKLTEGIICDNLMPKEDRMAHATGIERKNGKTYVAGATQFDISVWHPTYWTDIEFDSKNYQGTVHEPTALSDGSTWGCGVGDSEMRDIGVLNGETIAVGSFGTTPFAAIWFNGVRHTIETNKMSEAFAIFIDE